MPFYDTLCYCDEFCKRTDTDCCPDYYSNLCHFPSTAIPKPTPTASGDACIFEGNSYGLGDTVQDNCNTCVCEVDELFGGLEFRCTTDICAIQNPEETNNQGKGWKAGNYTKFWGKTIKEARLYRTGTLQPPGGVAQQNEVDIDKAEDLLPMFDVRDKWGDLIGGIQDQGDCGSSWAASTIALASDRLAIQSRGTITQRLSMQHLLSCNSRNQRGCDGGYTDRAYWFLRKKGVVSDECYPLKSGQSEDTSMDKLTCELGYLQSYPCPNGDVTSELQRSSPPYRIGMNQEEIMLEIMRNGPVQATFQVKDDFFSYVTGVYQYSGSDGSEIEGFHSVRILGWGKEISEDGTELPYWLCANSWGTDWGEDGYFRILRGKNECDIESFVVGVWGQVDAGMHEP
ncbi:hypothetical protein BSL78_22306 [Apostichopus japonicus]|uniref:Peptidase C1A papain C-terminal domain-containing protein n=1 Tax=Stichopus japonicus TaxID=307972 RepID=A0A2G8JYS4_STIJA|nr:hypothetical protein BSL78_22306 [Apostichopus japonicus]